jgi:hypothetical protein
MSESLIKTKRTALSWDPEFKPFIKNLEEYLGRMKGANAVTNTDVFMLCLAVGFELDKTRQVPPRKSDAVRISYLKEPHLAIMKSVALSHTQDHMILMNEDKVYDIVEQYAAGGLEILAMQMENQINFETYLVKILYESLKKTSQNNSAVKP